MVRVVDTNPKQGRKRFPIVNMRPNEKFDTPMKRRVRKKKRRKA